jgi:hypothetical protein
MKDFEVRRYNTVTVRLSAMNHGKLEKKALENSFDHRMKSKGQMLKKEGTVPVPPDRPCAVR